MVRNGFGRVLVAVVVGTLGLILLPSESRASCPGTKTCAGCKAAFCDGDVWTCDGFKAAGAACTDSNLCTTGESCDGAGHCVPPPGQTVTCNPAPECHLEVTCNATTGTCPTTYPNAPDGKTCSAPENATATCLGGACQPWACNTGYKKCEARCIPSGQCCTNADCAIANGTLTCSSGTGTCTSPPLCNSGMKVCGSSCIPSSQCCTAAGCPAVTNGSAVCNSGVCGASCPTNYTACSSTLCVNLTAGGCCTNSNCGSNLGHQMFCVKNTCSITCGANSDCSLPGNVGEQTCSSGVCGSPVICADGYKACAGTNTCIVADGCCSGADCSSGMACSNGACTLSCAAGTQPCGTSCVPTSASVCCPRDN